MQSMKALFIRDSCARYQWSMSSKTKKKKTTNAFAWLLFLLFLFYCIPFDEMARAPVRPHTQTQLRDFLLWPSCELLLLRPRLVSFFGAFSLTLVMCIEKRNDGTGLSAFPNSIRQLTKMEIQLDISNRQCVTVCVPNRSAVLASTTTHSFFLLLTEDSVFTFSSDVDKESDTTPAPNEEEEGRRRYTEEGQNQSVIIRSCNK